MAVTIESISTGGSTNSWISSGTAVTAPTGVEEGDQLVAVWAGYGYPSAFACTTSTGWTSRFTDTDMSGGGDSIMIIDKVADATDAAASTFTFTWTGATGCIMIARLSGCPASGGFDVVYDSESDTARTVTKSGAALLAANLRSHDDDVYTTTSSSGWAMLNAPNPEWTQRLDAPRDQTQNGDRAVGFATAYLGYAQEINDLTVTSSNESWSDPRGDVVIAYVPRTTVNEPVVESVANATQADVYTSSLTVSKPTGLAADDLLLAVYGAPGTPNTPSGWTKEITHSNNSGFVVFSKIADSTDVAASDFTFSTSQTGGTQIVSLYRITGHDYDNIIYDFDASKYGSTGSISSATEISASSIDVKGATNNCLAIMATYSHGSSVNNYITHADPSITGQINPTWAERYDSYGQNASNNGTHAMMTTDTVLRTNDAITEASVTITPNASQVWNYNFIFMVLQPKTVVVPPTIESKSSANVDASSMAITKPTGLAVGELMVAFIHSESIVTGAPSGWTDEENSYESGYPAIRMYSKVADSTDVAASTFTWTFGSSFDNWGSIFRISGQTTNWKAFSDSGSDSSHSSQYNDPDYTSTHSTSLTPTIDKTLLLVSYNGTHGKNSTSFDLTGGTNPVWTEEYDVAATESVGQNVVASGVYVGTTEITALKVTGEATFTHFVAIGINGTSSSFGSTELLEDGDETVFVPTPSVGTTGTITAITEDGDETIPAPTSTSQNRVWTNQTKASGTWTNQSK